MNLEDEEQHVSEADDQSIGETLLSQMQSPEVIAAHPSSAHLLLLLLHHQLQPLLLLLLLLTEVLS